MKTIFAMILAGQTFLILVLGVYGFIQVTNAKRIEKLLIEERKQRAQYSGLVRNKPNELTYLVTFKTTPQKVSTFKTDYAEIVKKCGEEEGCTNYIFHQSPTDSTVFMLLETWVTKDMWIKHT